jgi:hypothetical protein
MMMSKKSFVKLLLVLILSGFCSNTVVAQTTTMVILDEVEVKKLRTVVEENSQARHLADSIRHLAEEALERTPRPLEIVYFEGLLETNPKRIDTKISFLDIDATLNLIYASYLKEDKRYGAKAVEFATAWASTYKPTGNPINENKFVAFYWTYHVFHDHFSDSEKRLMEDWMRRIVVKELDREHTPNNNWQAKRLKMIGIIGCILEDEDYQQFAIDGFKKYLGSAYYADGTSRDLRQRDALHYHVSGIKPTLSVFVNLSKFNPEFDLFDFVGREGGSIKKSVEYTLPFARGEKQRQEWVNTTVKLDKERAAAGLAAYQPGMLFDPRKAKPTFQWAVYYNPDWYDILGPMGHYASSWVGLLNSPWIRKK